jgi:hypothetical protein
MKYGNMSPNPTYYSLVIIPGLTYPKQASCRAHGEYTKSVPMQLCPACKANAEPAKRRFKNAQLRRARQAARAAKK